MAGRGPAPKPDARRRNKPARGAMRKASSFRWDGETPDPPDGMMQASVEAWSTWFDSWFASFWTTADLPGLRQVIRLYDQVERGEFQRSSELRLQMDTYGITPKGQQDRRWQAPEAEDGGVPKHKSKKGRTGTYAHLAPVD